MLRLANIDSKELRESLRYVEMQLAKSKEQLRQANSKLEETQNAYTEALEEVARKGKINHAQAVQIEDQAKKIANIDAEQAKLQDDHKRSVAEKQKQIDLNELALQ